MCRIRYRVAAAVAVAGLLLSGCASGPGDGPAGPPTLAQVAQTVGATGLQETDTAMYERAEGLATLGGQDVQVVTFNTVDAKDAWIRTSQQFGTTVIKSGPLWIVATV